MESYNRLVGDFCALTGIDDVADVLHRGLLDIDGVSIRVECSDSGDQCRILADLGEVPPDREADLYKFMLESNFECDDEPGQPVLSMSAEGNRGVLTTHFLVSELLGEGGLVKVLREQVLPLVNAWVGTINDDDVPDEVGRIADVAV